MAWDLSNYEDVASLNKWFQDNYPMGSIRVYKEHFDPVKAEILFRCDLYRDVNDIQPAVVNWARGKAEDYPKNMARWYVEDTSTSVIGRSILLLKGADKTATKDSMEQVKVFKPIPEPLETPIENEPETVVWDEVEVKAVDPQVNFIETLQESLKAKVIDMKCKHGAMISKRGQSKTGRAYYGYVCAASPKSEQCEPVWGKEMSGKWVFEDKAVHYG